MGPLFPWSNLRFCNISVTYPNTINVASYSFILSLFFISISIVSFVQICRIKYHRHSLLHYQFGFLLYCFIWSLLRFVYWFLIPWDDVLEETIGGVTLILQFQTFTLLALFYAQIVFKANNSWIQYRNLTVGGFIVINVAFFVAFIVHILINFIIFLWLPSDEYHFTAYGIKELLNAFDIAKLDIISPKEQSVSSQVAIFFVYFCWDIVPAVMVIIIFWHIPNPSASTPHKTLVINDSSGIDSFGRNDFESSSFLRQPVSSSNEDTIPTEIKETKKKSTNLIDMSPSSFSRLIKSTNSFKDKHHTFTGYSTKYPSFSSNTPVDLYTNDQIKSLLSDEEKKENYFTPIKKSKNSDSQSTSTSQSQSFESSIRATF